MNETGATTAVTQPPIRRLVERDEEQVGEVVVDVEPGPDEARRVWVRVMRVGSVGAVLWSKER